MAEHRRQKSQWPFGTEGQWYLFSASYTVGAVLFASTLLSDGSFGLEASRLTTAFFHHFINNASLLFEGRVVFVAAVVSAIAALVSQPGSTARQILYPIPFFLFVLAFTTPLHTTNTELASGEKYQFGMIVATWAMRVLDRLYLNNPEDLRYATKDKKKAAEVDSPAQFSVSKKLAWAVELVTVTRGVGWNWQIGKLPPQRHTSRTAFVYGRLVEVGLTIATLALIAQSAKALDLLASAPADSPVLAKVLLNSIVLCAFLYTSWAFIVFSLVSLPENIFALVFVGLRIGRRWSDPDLWPPVFGSMAETYSLRRIWGVWWHQNLRRSCTSPANFLTSKIRYLRERKTERAVLISRYVRLMVTFVFSGAIHAAGSLYMSQGRAQVSDGGNIIAFFLQGGFLILEDFSLWCLNIDDSKPPSLARRLIGYAVMHGYATFAVTYFKVLPLARDSRLAPNGDPWMAGVRLVGQNAHDVLRSPFTSVIGSWNLWTPGFLTAAGGM